MADAIFIREKKDRDYTVIDNTCLKDSRLSWKAKGLFCYILSLPEDWQIHLSEVERHATDGRDSLRTAVKELKDFGYLKTVQSKNVDGTFGATIFKVIEKPQTENPSTVNPTTEKPQADNPQTENPKLQNTDITKYQNKQSTKKISAGARVKDAPDALEKMKEYDAIRHNYVINGIDGQVVMTSEVDKAYYQAIDLKKSGDKRDIYDILEERLRECVKMRN